jgi:hypothetical protein
LSLAKVAPMDRRTGGSATGLSATDAWAEGRGR